MSTPPSPPSINQNQESNPHNGNWWETYVIRYFVGTVIGGAILLFLNTSESSSLKGSLLPGLTTLEELDAASLTVVAAAGLAYCYLASAPILVLHASRSSFLKSRKKWIDEAIGAMLFTVFAVGIFAYFVAPDHRPIIFSASLMILLLGAQGIYLGAATSNRAEASHQYYLKLTHARSIQNVARQEYKQSYRHLREHGNAFLILFFEGLLGVILAGVPNAPLALVVLLFWIMPAAMVWVHGTILEARYAKIK